MRENPYFLEIQNNLPRILSLIDNDPTSKSYGLGDRYFWAWGLTDFGNATFQGCAHGLSKLWASGLWPYESNEEFFLKRIQSIFAGTKTLTRKDGSLEEAFPHEGSYCVTALVAFDLLVTIDLLSNSITSFHKDESIEVVRPLIKFLVKSDESHAIISNHLATAVAALVRWDILMNDSIALKKAELLLDRIINNQSEEGWFREYEGADPGYQTLCLHYLVDAHLKRRGLNLSEPIAKSLRFLQYFAHPDGSFGGHYGSRCTRFYYPSGILAMATEIPESAALADYMSSSIAGNKVVVLSSIDEPNLIPMFNSYCWSATLQQEGGNQMHQNKQEIIPCKRNRIFRKNFSEAGILVDRGEKYYSIINYKKGGSTYHFVDSKLKNLNCGIVVQSPSGLLGSNNFYDEHQSVLIQDSSIKIRSRISEMPKKLTSPFKFLVLRILCFSIFRISFIREFTKKVLVRYLITRPKLWKVWCEREIIFGKNLEITDRCDFKRGYKKIIIGDTFVPIHMASKGYWQKNDERK